jgi:hypothetical protein
MRGRRRDCEVCGDRTVCHPCGPLLDDIAPLWLCPLCETLEKVLEAMCAVQLVAELCSRPEVLQRLFPEISRAIDSIVEAMGTA